ncbi:AAA family ATPase [Clostridium thermarum]|uniref:AAA family ATPase n=1 Tax=Clostridium thermarum TaxID=1716543 RepID=UPI0011207DAF|nr:MoxR family ATPase [Clostridium thermarum]
MIQKELVKKIISNVEKSILGKGHEITDIVKGILAGGHILMEDVPGVGKTTLAKALAKTVNLQCKRIQCTPDLLPSDILGVSIYNQKSQQFEFKKGPVFTNILLADEINRTSPKTQSALLEVMEEEQVSDGNETYYLEAPFIVIATQNPVEQQGTFMLPEAQLDRFMIKVKLGYVDAETESNILETLNERKETLEPIVDGKDILELQRQVRKVHAAKPLLDYIVNIIQYSRVSKYIALGGSTRASIALLRTSQAMAFINGRDYIIPDDVKKNVYQVLCHRIILSPVARANSMNEMDVVSDILDRISIPRY